MPPGAKKTSAATKAKKHSAISDMTAKEETRSIPTIGYVVLSRLAQSDHTGYDLALFMGPPRNFIWEANHSQIYPLLALLTELDYVRFTEVAQSGRPNKKVYNITEAGRLALKDWVRDAPTPMTRRLEFNAKVNALWLLPKEEAIDVLQRQIEMTEAEIEMIESHMSDAEMRAGISFPPPPASKFSGLYANIKYAIESRHFMINWYKWILADFEAAPPERKRPKS
ncbi:Transcriptional regulator PadR-like family protein [compost metagenome]|uniref:PadR family transcriptional regulator n=1 Tax=Variovorax boronicumulans TaxID=436515 RepID=UPI000F9B3302